MSTVIILQQMAVIAILVSIGILLYRKKTIDNLTSKKISSIIVDVCNPALILSSILSGNMTAQRKDLITAIIISMIFYAVIVIIGFVFPVLIRAGKDKRRFYNLMNVYTNIGFIGIPLAKAILPENAILYVIVMNVMYCLLFYTHGITILSAGKEKLDLKKIFSPGTVMAVLSLVVFWFNIKLPDVLANTVSFIGNATVFLSMIMLGAMIARSDIKKGFKDIRIWLYVAFRMTLIPVAAALILRALGFDPVTVLAVCLVASMPVGNLPLIQAEKTGEDTQILSSAITVSTIMSLITITALMSVFSYILN
ncbi:MAG: AEC family transporter [Clostridiales bacterium]|nr:AEC family transporter [Clostridiales bacterium]